MTSRSIEHPHPLLAYAYGKAEAEYAARYPEAPQPFLTCAYHDNAEQTALYNQPSDGKNNDRDGFQSFSWISLLNHAHPHQTNASRQTP